jgi:pilus assembly protein CpaF
MISKEIFEQTLMGFFAPIREYLIEDGISEVLVNGPNLIYIEKKGRLQLTDAKFANQEELISGLRNLAQYVGRPFDNQHPILEGRMPDGSRVEAVMAPAAPEGGPYISIRRFYREKLTPERLVELGSVTPEAMAMLKALVACKQNIMVAGGTSSGKTSLLNVLSGFASPEERIVVIEDAQELQLPLPHLVRLEAQPGDAKGKGKITIRDLFKATLRMRPDRIVVGELRGAEALDLIQSMTSGHGGGLSTIHASHAKDTTSRLETLAMMSDVDLPLHALRAQIASAIEVIVHVERIKTGARCVTAISEIVGYDHEKGYQIEDLFIREYEHDEATNEMKTWLRPTGRLPRCIDQIRAMGIQLPNLDATTITKASDMGGGHGGSNGGGHSSNGHAASANALARTSEGASISGALPPAPAAVRATLSVPPPTPKDATPPRLGDRGSITVEFVFLTALFALPVSAAFVAIGEPLLQFFRYAQLSMVAPFP